MSGNVCSPLGLDEFKTTGTCFSLSALQELALAWNKQNPTQPPINTAQDVKSLRNALDAAMTPQCGQGKGKEVCWVQKLGGFSVNREAAKMVMPPKPKEWNKNPHQWLNNYDIQHIMTRMEGDAKYPYKFFGVFPIDFQGNDDAGEPLYSEMHTKNFSLQKYVGKYRFLGFITNLDSHEGPGTHWTSTFIAIDPALPCFGAYYYDSTFSSRTDVSRVPPEIRKFFKQLKEQAKTIPNPEGRVFKNVFYRMNHQHGNTECGMFSIFYQVYWLNRLIKDMNVTHRDIVRLKITDDQVWKLRDFFFGPTQ